MTGPLKARAHPTIKARGDTWSVRLAERPPSPDVRVILFFCVTSGQRPYRVVEVSAERVPDADGLAALDRDELRGLFDASVSMDYPRGYPTYEG